MKITMSQAFPLFEFCSKLSEQQLPIKVSYKFAKAVNVLAPEIEFYRGQYSRYLRTYAQVDENGEFIQTPNGNIKIQEGKESECAQKFNELDSIEIDLPNFEFTLDELDSLELTVNDMRILAPFIKD
jgi:HAMP domain-containing protein